MTPELYGHLTHWLSSLANGRVILSLEGGYNINSITHAMTMCTKSLLGDPLPMLEHKSTPCTSAINSINNVLKTHRRYWHNLKFSMSLPKEKLLAKIGKLSESKSMESKILPESIKDEKLELAVNETQINSVMDEEILKLSNKIENIKIKEPILKTIQTSQATNVSGNNYCKFRYLQ